ncbi:MAG TPA: hypothetical protein VFP85_16005 [Vicinamibacterales bacterium]|nr:hypothetical protein [Vicinamibacterales bacterium]
MPTNRESKSSAQPVGNGPARTGNGSAGNPGLLGGIQQKVTSRVDEQKNRAADGLGGIANVFRNAGNELRTENETMAQYVDMASDQLRRFADQIRQRGVADMLDDVHMFARRRPALFLGGAFVIGVALARFLKSSGERRSYATGEPGFSSVDPMTTQNVAPAYGGVRSGFDTTSY